MDRRNAPGLAGMRDIALRTALRHWLARNVQLMAFLSSYMLTVVLGNVLYASPIGRDFVVAARLPTAIFEFPTAFTFGFWMLLLLPFFVAPPVAVLTRRLTGHHVVLLARALPDFRAGHYALLTCCCYAFVAIAYWRSGALSLVGAGSDFVSSLEARYAIRAALGGPALIVLQSILVFLSLYSVVKALRPVSYAWSVVAGLNVICVSVLLLFLNMKWPNLLFMAGVVLTLFLFAPRAPYLTATVGAVLVLGGYVAIATYVFRLPPAPAAVAQPTGTPSATGQYATRGTSTPAANMVTSVKPTDRPSTAQRFAQTARHNATLLMLLPVHRMALSYPYYYDIFTREGSVCGGVAEQVKQGPRCRPSALVYSRMFKDDAFQGRGTAPAGVHISGYAVGGWALALAGLIIASAIIGLFSSLPLEDSAVVGALSVTGALAGYHFSQIPGEGVIFYEHGLLWIGLLLAGYAAYRALFARSPRSSTGGVCLMLLTSSLLLVLKASA